MAIKLVVLDLDGTLTDSNKKLPAANREALLRLEEKGVRVALASGRPTYGIKLLAEELKLSKYNGYIMAYNGGFVIDCATGQTISRNILPRDIFGQLKKASNELNAAIITYDDQRDTILTETQGNKWIEHEAWLNNQMNLEVVSDIDEAAPEALPKCLMVGEPEHIAQIEPIMKERFSQLSIYRSSPFFLEIVPLGVDKAKSIDNLRQQIGIEISEIAAFGDGYNDISMVEYAGIGVAMANGCDEIKKIADFVSLTNDENGVAYAIEKLNM
ncbi:MAG: Cof-type HAD-IIB family hydrolase [Bacteroidales bacterium]|nr:Cof-type HAD-IIB family hydrolase [Bacteroidales bacterium]